MAWKVFGRIQIWNVMAVLGSYLFCELPFVKSHFVNLNTGAGGDTEIVGWTPFILLFVLTAGYYVWVSVHYSRSAVALIDQPFCFTVYVVLVMGLAVKTPFFLNSAWNYFQFGQLNFWRLSLLLRGV